MGKIRLVVSDVDDTLYSKTAPIPEGLPALIQECRSRGIAFGLATGRTRELAAPLIQQLQLTDPCVLANGALIIQGDRTLVKHGFHVEQIRPILRRACGDGLTVTVSDDRLERPLSITPYILERQQRKGRFLSPLDPDSEELAAGEFLKVMILDPARSGRIVPYQQQLQQYRDHYWVTSFSTQAVELGPKDCNKATGVRELAALLGLQMHQVMAIGDFCNDLEMIREAGIGVAVANASEEVREKADYVTREPVGRGVMEALKKFCLEDESVDDA